MSSSETRLEEPSIDCGEVRRALSILMAPQSWHELIWINPGQSRQHREIVSGTNIEQSVINIKSNEGKNIYISVNPSDCCSKKPSNTDVTCYRWLTVEVITTHCKGKNALDEEKRLSRIVAAKVQIYLQHEIGWTRPVVIDSGNEWNLLYQIDLPNIPMSRSFVKRVLENLSRKFNNQFATVNNIAYQPMKFIRVPGTINLMFTKPSPRMARIVYLPEKIETVDFDKVFEVIKGSAKTR